MPLRIPNELIGDLRQGFHCSRRVLREIIKRIDKDEDFKKAWRQDVTPDFFKDLIDNLLDGANNLLYIFGVGGSGKSIVGMTIVLYQENVFQDKLKKKVVKGFCRNYGRANIIKAKIRETGAKGIILLDEDVRLTGFETQVVRDNFFNALDTMRIEQTCIVICSPKHRKDILVPNIQRWFGCLEVLMKNREKQENLCIWYSREGAEGKVYIPVYPDHPLWKWITAWKKREQDKQTAALGASAAETWPLRQLAEDILEKAHKEFPGVAMQPKDLQVAAELMREEDNLVLSTHKTDMACQLAYRMKDVQPPGPSQSLEEPEAILANGGDPESEPEPEKLPEEDYQALRHIALEELSKGVPGIKASIIEEVREYDYPTDALTHEQEWTYREVRQQLNSPLRAESVGKNIRFYKKDAGNRPAEIIGARFIRWKLDHTPNFPTQFTTAGGPGERDISFTVQGKLVASANVKHFLDHVARTIHLAPEFTDPVHYAIILRTKPFAIQAYRGTGKEYLDAGAGGGSVFDLGWAGFVEDLRKEAEKAGNSEQASSPA